MEIFKTYLLPAIAWLLVTGIPAIISIVLKVKQAKVATEALSVALTEQEKAEALAKVEAAKNAIATELKRLVAEAEVLFKPVDDVMKRQNSSAGTLKKGHVVTNLKAFCLEHGFAWDLAEMDEAIEAEVAYTKTVNGKSA